MTGALSAPLFLYALITQRSVPSTLSAILAVGCLYFASYRVWRAEHLKVLEQEGKNSLPRFKGRLHQVSISATQYADTARVGTALSCIMDVYNDSPTPSAIVKLVLTIADTDGTVYHCGRPALFPLQGEAIKLSLPTRSLARGEAESFEVMTNLGGLRSGLANKASLKIRVVDAFSGDHYIST